jgi:hypothetical protein
MFKIEEKRATGAFRESSPRSGRREATLIKEGWGSSGYYGGDVLAEYGPVAWPEGTRMFLNHPTFQEEASRPERDVKDWVGKIASTPRMAGIELVAEVEVFDHWQPVINGLAKEVGLSIVAPGTVEMGAAGGREGPIVKELAHDPMNSVDYVTIAGAGGKLGTLIESARGKDHPEREEDEEKLFEKLLREADDEKLQVFISRAVSLKESRSETSGGKPTKEQRMDEVEKLRDQLSEAQDKLKEAESSKKESDDKLAEAIKERDEAKQSAERAEDAIATSGARSIAREVANRVEGMPDRARDRVVESASRDLPRKEDGKLDEEKVREAAKVAAKKELEYLAGKELEGDLPLRESGGETTVTTTTANGGEVSEEQLVEAFKAQGMSEEAAKTAAKGR